METSNSDVAPGLWSITTWLSANPAYIAVLLAAILVPLVLYLDRIGMEPGVPTKPAKPSIKEAKKDK